jgi:hypothetical protein
MVAADESTLGRVNRVVKLGPAAGRRRTASLGAGRLGGGPKVNEGFLWNPM